jgi:hypothetical protein
MTPELILFFFSADSTERPTNRYRILFEAAKLADQSGSIDDCRPEPIPSAEVLNEGLVSD